MGLICAIALSADGTTIIDGRFRYLALRWNGIDPASATTVLGGPALRPHPDLTDDDAALHYVSSMNIRRQHLNDGQVAIIGCKLELSGDAR